MRSHAEEARIADTREGIATRTRGWPCSTRALAKRNQQLDDTQTALVKARVRLSRLERKQAQRREDARGEPALELHGR